MNSLIFETVASCLVSAFISVNTYTHPHTHTHTHAQKKADGQALFEQIIRRLEITQKEYFGLEFEDDHKIPVRNILIFVHPTCQLVGISYWRIF